MEVSACAPGGLVVEPTLAALRLELGLRGLLASCGEWLGWCIESKVPCRLRPLLWYLEGPATRARPFLRRQRCRVATGGVERCLTE